MVSTISLPIFIGISVFYEPFLLLNLLSSLTISSCEMKLKLATTKFFRLLSSCIYTKVVFFIFKSRSTSFKSFSGKVALSFSVNIPTFLRKMDKRFAKYLWDFSSLSITSSFSINLIVSLALTLFEKSSLTFCQNFLLSKTKFTLRFAKMVLFGSFHKVNTNISLPFEFLRLV